MTTIKEVINLNESNTTTSPNSGPHYWQSGKNRGTTATEPQEANT